MKRKKQKSMFADMQGAALGMGSLGVSFGVAGAAGSMSPVPVTGGLQTMAGFMPMLGTTVGAGSVLKQTKKLKKYY